MSIDDEAGDASLRRQVKALVHSSEAVRLAGELRYAAALGHVHAALSLDDRLDRQATWTGLQGLWRLQLCQVGAGEHDLRRSLAQRRDLIRAGRLPPGSGAEYQAAYGDAVEAAEARCGQVSGLEGR